MSELFDQIIDRTNTYSDKWDLYAGQDILPMWLADMDFRAPDCVVNALIARSHHGVFGYTRVPDELEKVAGDMLEREYGWAVEREWMVWLPGLVPGLHLGCAAHGNSGDEVLVATPIYPPFLGAPARMNRTLVTVDADPATGALDFAALERAVTSRTRVLMLCNPHNPTGRAWSRKELERIGDFCVRHDLVVVSDEIHCEIILDPGRRHQPIGALDHPVRERTITLMAPSKTYNIAGLACSLAIIPDPDLRARFEGLRAGLVPGVNTFGYTAAMAAWRDCPNWRADLLDYLRGNRDLVQAAVDAHPRLSMHCPDATFLAWIDARAIDPEEPLPHFEAAGIGPSDGRDFGRPGFVRLNFGCPRELLEQALERLARVGRGTAESTVDRAAGPKPAS